MSPRAASAGRRHGVPSRSSRSSHSGAERYRYVPLKAKLKIYDLEDPEFIEAVHWSEAEIAPDRPREDPVQEMVAPSEAEGGDDNNGQIIDELERLADALNAAWDGGELTPEAIDASIKGFRSRHPYRP